MFRMTVQDVFFIRGRGAVATGRVEAGSLRVGDEVTINGDRTLRVDGIEAFRKVLDEAAEGQNIGVLFKKLAKQDLAIGDVITSPGGAPGASGRDPRFAHAEAQREQYLTMREAGVMTTAQVEQALRELMFSLDGRYWVLTAASDQWYASEGTSWVPATPGG